MTVATQEYGFGSNKFANFLLIKFTIEVLKVINYVSIIGFRGK